MCRTLGVARRGCCRWAKRPTSAHDLRDLELAKLIGGEHEAGMGVYGAPKVTLIFGVFSCFAVQNFEL